MLEDRCVVNGIELAYRHRPGRGPCAVFVSGLGEPATGWDGVIERLPADLATFVYDRAGCGDSGAVVASENEPRSIVWGAEQILALLDAVDVPGPWLLVGHSMGGLIVDAFARLWPDRVHGLVLVDASDPALHTMLDESEPVLVDGREGEGWRISLPATLEQFGDRPQQAIETVVIDSAPWRWLPVEQASEYRPFTLIEMDQLWHRHQLGLAERWSGHLVVPHFAGHHVHRDSPDLVAEVIGSFLRGDGVQLDQASLVCSGGTVRVSVQDGSFVEWAADGPRRHERE